MNALGAFLTVAVYYAYLKLYERKPAFYLNPVLLSIATIAALLAVTRVSYSEYMESAGVISYFLGPAVVSLAVPLYRQRRVIARHAAKVAAAVAVGGLVAALTATLPLMLAGAPRELVLSMAPKSATTAIAVEVSAAVGGVPSLTAVFVILTGILGNAAGPEVLSKARVEDRLARGLALGVAAHGLGTARAVLEDELEGAASSLAMALNGAYTAAIVPLLARALLPSP